MSIRRRRPEKTGSGMRNAAKSVRATEILLRTVIDNLPAPVFLKDLQGRLLACNREFVELTGIPREKALGRITHDFFPRELAEIMRRDDQEIMRRGVALVSEVVIPCADGQRVFETTKLPVRDEKGEIYAICGISRDMTGQKRSEARLREAELRLRAFIQSQIIGIVVADTGGAITEANDAFLDIVGYTREEFELYGLRWDALTPEEWTAGDLRANEQLRQHGILEPMEKEYFHRDRHRVPVLIGGAGFEMTEDLVRTVCFVQDLTERKRVEHELSRKNREIEQFIYAISHDLRSPLITIRSFLGYLEQDMKSTDAEKVGRDLYFIKTAAVKMEQMLHELLEMSRIGRSDDSPVRVTFYELVREALSLVAGRISERRVAISVSDRNPVLIGNHPKLARIWQNLLENSVKYLGDQPEPRIELGVEPGNVVVFFVRDNGIGIAPDDRARIFGMFEKLDKGSSGVGLGLAMVKKIVEGYQGDIWVESDGKGKGACFRFTLPGAMKSGEDFSGPRNDLN